MALQTSGAISLANIQSEFGGSNPISLSEYYGMGGVTGSGQISIGNFYGTSAGIASYSFTRTRDSLVSGTVVSDTVTFPTAVASGSTVISLAGTQYAHLTNHTPYTNVSVVQAWFQVALYNGSTLLHTTAAQAATLTNVGNYASSTYTHTFTAVTVSQPITKAILYRHGNVATTCHVKDVCTVTIG
jgi:hypothetical protein